MKKTIFVVLFLSSFLTQSAQIKPEIKEVKRFMSLGEKPGIKILLPNQELSKAEKLNKEFIKNQHAEIVKSPKGSNEQIFKKFYIKGIEQPLLLIALMEQEGKNVGWTGYFFNEKDTSIFDNKIATEQFVTAIFNKSMFSLYEDSIIFQEKNIKEVNGNLKDQSKGVEKNQKCINKAKDKIRNADLEIEKANSTIATITPLLTGLTNSKSDMQAKLKLAENELNKTKDVENEIKESLNKAKKQSKNLSELEKDPATNANLILAQKNDIAVLTQSIEKRQLEYTTILATAKAGVKSAEKDLKNAESSLKDAEKNLKKANSSIGDANKDITEARNEIEENQKQINKFNETEKTKSEEAIKTQAKILEDLKVNQGFYK